MRLSRLGNAARAGRQVERRRCRAHAGDELPRRIAQFAGQFEHHIAAQREAHQETPGRALPVKLAEHRQKVAGEAGVVQGLAEMLRAAAGAHVEAMRGESRTQRRGTQTAHVACIAGTFQAVHQDDFAAASPRGRCEVTST